MGLVLPVMPGYHRDMLNVIEHGTPSERPPVLIAHGLYGSARNWGVIAKRLSADRSVFAVDMRNHGDSPHFNEHGYPAMAEDLAEVIDSIGATADVIGHSMGGKAAMALALSHGEKLRRLVVADIAPVSYSHSQIQFIHAMRGVDLDKVQRRADAEAQLAAQGVEDSLRSFLTQSLDIPARRWRLNLDTLENFMPQIMSFPDYDTVWQGPALFLSGGQSDYVTPAHRPIIKTRFPAARFAKIPKAGHWLHAEKPREFEATVRLFLDTVARS